MGLKPKVSVIMPVYNSEKHLFHSINSILTQTLIDFEFIIIDDGSNDNSLNIIKSFNDRRIKIISNEYNLGISAALNMGFHLCSGFYIARMDSDDISFNNRLEKQVIFMECNKEFSICGCNMFALDPKQNVNKEINYCLTDAEIKSDMFFGKTPFAHPTIMIRNSFVQQHNIKYNVNALYAEDLELYCNCCNIAKYANLNKHLHFYRIHDNSVSIKHKMQQRKTARSIVNSFLVNEGLSLTPKEFDIHCSLYLPEGELKCDNNDAFSWYNKVRFFAQNNRRWNNDRFYYLIERIYEKWRS